MKKNSTKKEKFEKEMLIGKDVPEHIIWWKKNAAELQQ